MSQHGRSTLFIVSAIVFAIIVAIAGPATFFTLLQANAINRLYLTFAHKILAGQVFDHVQS